MPFKPEFQDIYETIKQAVESSENTLRKIGDFKTDDLYIESIKREIKNADIVIADVSEANPDVMYELGLAQSIAKRIILISQKGESLPYQVINSIILFYDRKQLQQTLIRPLINYFSKGEFDQFNIHNKVDITTGKEEIKTVFISYSHEDASYLRRLLVHLRPFEKNGFIDLWVDTKIKVGEKWKERINLALDKSALAILLISADFLASDFIVDNELPPLLKATEEKGKLILPVVLKPCRFTRDQNLSIFQAINDPKIPLSRMDENDREEVYVKIADYIDNLVKRKT